MRKLISLGSLALLLSLLASPVSAGKWEECKFLKSGDFTKGLYGLCNAFHNAGNDNARQRILNNYNSKAGPGDPPMPGTEPVEVTCPCLDAIDIVGFGTKDWGIAVNCSNDGNGVDQGIFVNPALSNLTTFFTTSSDGVIHLCAIDQSPATRVMLEIDGGEYDECLSQLLSLCP